MTMDTLGIAGILIGGIWFLASNQNKSSVSHQWSIFVLGIGVGAMAAAPVGPQAIKFLNLFWVRYNWFTRFFWLIDRETGGYVSRWQVS